MASFTGLPGFTCDDSGTLGYHSSHMPHCPMCIQTGNVGCVQRHTSGYPRSSANKLGKWERPLVDKAMLSIWSAIENPVDCAKLTFFTLPIGWLCCQSPFCCLCLMMGCRWQWAFTWYLMTSTTCTKGASCRDIVTTGLLQLSKRPPCHKCHFVNCAECRTWRAWRSQQVSCGCDGKWLCNTNPMGFWYTTDLGLHCSPHFYHFILQFQQHSQLSRLQHISLLSLPGALQLLEDMEWNGDLNLFPIFLSLGVYYSSKSRLWNYYS